MRNLASFLKRTTVFILLLSAVFFFSLPYFEVHGFPEITPLHILTGVTNANQRDRGTMLFMLVWFSIPVALNFLSAIMMMPKYKPMWCIFALLFNGIALVIYQSDFAGSMVFDNTVSESIGLSLNRIVATLGVILPIFVIEHSD